MHPTIRLDYHNMLTAVISASYTMSLFVNVQEKDEVLEVFSLMILTVHHKKKYFLLLRFVLCFQIAKICKMHPSNTIV